MVLERILEEKKLNKVSIVFPEYVIEIPGDKIGIFSITGIEKVVCKYCRYKNTYKAQGILLEIHHDCVCEIEMLLKVFSSRYSMSVESICIVNWDDTIEEYSVENLFRRQYYRITSRGDMRIILGEHSTELFDRYESTAIGFFDAYPSRDFFNGVCSGYIEKKNHNYKKNTYDNMRFTASIIKNMQIYAGIKNPKYNCEDNERLALYLSILDTYLMRQNGISIGINQYTTYSEESGRWANIRMDNLLWWYPKATDELSIYKAEVALVADKLQYKSNHELGAMRGNFTLGVLWEVFDAL